MGRTRLFTRLRGSQGVVESRLRQDPLTSCKCWVKKIDLVVNRGFLRQQCASNRGGERLKM